MILKNHSAGNISGLFLGEVNVPGLFPQSKMRFRGYFHCSGETFYGQLSLMLRSAKVTASDLLTTIIQDQHMSGASQHMFGLLKYKEMPLQGQEATSTKRQKNRSIKKWTFRKVTFRGCLKHDCCVCNAGLDNKECSMAWAQYEQPTELLTVACLFGQFNY